jgi:hypothetical protein
LLRVLDNYIMLHCKEVRVCGNKVKYIHSYYIIL